MAYMEVTNCDIKDMNIAHILYEGQTTFEVECSTSSHKCINNVCNIRCLHVAHMWHVTNNIVLRQQASK